MSKNQLQVLFISAFIGMICCQWQNEIDTGDLEKQLREEIPELNNFNASALPVEKVEEALKEKCEKNSGADAYTELMESKDNLKECFEKLVNFDIIQEELEKAEKTGSMDEVFGKYCNKYPEFQQCLDKFHQSIIPCLEDDEVPTVEKAFNTTNNIVQFACHNSGDRLAMFVAEGGVECLNSKKEDLQMCVNQTFGDDLQKNITQMADEALGPLPIPLFVLEEKNINQFNQLHTCVRKTLETCEESTPANVVDALFKYVKKLLFGQAAIEAAAVEEKANSASLSTLAVILLPVALSTTKLL